MISIALAQTGFNPRPRGLPPDLRAVAEAWPRLPEAVRAGIVAMVQAAAE